MLNPSLRGSVAEEDDKGSTESEGSTDDETDSLDKLSDESEFNEMTRENQMMEMAIIKNFLGRSRGHKKGKSDESLVLHTDMTMTHASERIDSEDSRRFSQPVAESIYQSSQLEERPSVNSQFDL